MKVLGGNMNFKKILMATIFSFLAFILGILFGHYFIWPDWKM
jgi:Sec-independent protein secretion pathway component TatC